MVSSVSSFCDSRLEKGWIQLSRTRFSIPEWGTTCNAWRNWLTTAFPTSPSPSIFPSLSLSLSLSPLLSSPLLSSPPLCSHC